MGVGYPRLWQDLRAQVADDQELWFGNDRDANIKWDVASDWLQISLGTVNYLNFNINSIVFNQSGADTDFRIESYGSAYMFYVDAGLDSIGIGVTAFDATGRKVVAIGNGTAPAAILANTVQIWAADYAAGDSRLYILSEAGTNIILGKGQILLGDGTALLPFMAPAGDPDTGPYSYAANELGIALAGLGKFRFSASKLYIGVSDSGTHPVIGREAAGGGLGIGTAGSPGYIARFFSDDFSTSVLDVVATGLATPDIAGVAASRSLNMPIAAGGAANAVLQWQFQLDGVIEAGLLGETDGAGSYTQLKTVWKIPYSDAGAGAIGPTAPTTAATWNGGLFLGASNAVANGRLYWYANEASHYVDATAGFSYLYKEPTTFGDFNNWKVGDLMLLKVDRYDENGGHALPYPFEKALQETPCYSSLLDRLAAVEEANRLLREELARCRPYR